MAAAHAGIDPGSTSVSLIARAKLQDAQAWDRLCRIYGPLVYRWIRDARIRDADAADVGQEVFLALSRRIASFDPAVEKGAFRGWLRGIARNKVGDRIRVIRRTLPTNDLPTHLLADEDEPEELRSTAHALLQRALVTLEIEFEPRTWQAFRLTAFDNRSAADVAAELGMSPEAVRQARYRVLNRLRTLMRDEKLG